MKKNLIRKILCAVDFSEFSRKIMSVGKRLAEEFDAGMIVFHTLCATRSQIYGTAESIRGEDLHVHEEKARKKIADLARGIEFPFDTVLGFGDPVDETIKASRTTGADIVIVASYGIPGWKRFLLGTVVERLSFEINRPLLVIRSPMGYGIQEGNDSVLFPKIVAGCTMNEKSHPAVRFSAVLASQLNSELHLVYSQEKPMDDEMMETPGTSYSEKERMFLEERKIQIESLKKDVAARMDNCKTAVVSGFPGESLCVYAASISADIIVIGAGSGTSLIKRIIGSTMETVLRNAPCSVLIVPPAFQEQNQENEN